MCDLDAYAGAHGLGDVLGCGCGEDAVTFSYGGEELVGFCPSFWERPVKIRHCGNLRKMGILRYAKVCAYPPPAQRAQTDAV